MSDRYRLLSRAAGRNISAALIGLLCASTHISAADQQAVSQASDDQTNPQAVPTKEVFDAVFWGIHRGEDPDTYQEICRKPQDREYAGLCQSWRQAEFSRQSVRWAVWQLWVSLVGVAGLLATIILSLCSLRIAQRALTDLERPFVIGRIRTEEATWTRDINALMQSANTSIQIVNIGKMPAILTRLEYQFGVAPNGSIIGSIDPRRVGGRELPVGIVSIPSDPFVEKAYPRKRFSPEMRYDESLWVTGFVRYQDVFGKHYIAGFTQVYDAIGARWVTRGNQKYNYARSEKRWKIPTPSSRG